MRELTEKEIEFVSGGTSSGEAGLEHIEVYGVRMDQSSWFYNPISIGQYLANNSPEEFEQYSQWYSQQYGEAFPSDGGSSTDLIVNGQDVNPNDMVLENDDTREKFEELVENLLAIDPDATIVITGGDRYVDDEGNVRSSTNHEIVPNASQNGYHNYGLAVDFTVVSSVISNSQIQMAANDAGFGGYDDSYPTGHIHVTNR